MKIKAIPKDLRPREKALLKGIDSLDNSELLALIIQSGTKGHSCLDISLEMLKKFVYLHSLSEAKYEELLTFKGLSKASALKLLATFTLMSRMEKEKVENNVHLHAKEIYDFLKDSLGLEDQENLLLLSFNKRKTLVRIDEVYRGTSKQIIVQSSDIEKRIYLSGAKYLVLVHNHPGGEAYPSENDIMVTLNLSHKLSSFPIEFYDHIIVTQGGYYSFRENHHLFASSK